MKIGRFSIFLGMLLTACVGLNAPAPTQTPPPAATLSPDTPVSPEDPTPINGANLYDPAPGDDALMRGEVFLDQHDLLTLESYPPQFQLHLVGSLPTPCHRLRAVVQPPDAEQQIKIEVYSLVDLSATCPEVLEPFELNLPLGSFTGGPYRLFLNGDEIGEFTG